MEAAERHAAQVWIRDFVEVYENGQQLTVPVIAATRTSLPSDRSFESYDAALANITTGAKLDQSTEIYWDQGMLDVMFEYPIQSDQSDFAIRPGLTRLGLQVNIVLRFLQPGKAERAFDVHADTGIVHLDPRWHQAFYLFAREGFFHILDGTDHLLFLLCLVIPFRKLRPLVDRDHVVHRRAFGDADRLGVRHGAGQPVVPAADRDADRDLDRLHGLREHRRRQAAAAMDGDVRRSG